MSATCRRHDTECRRLGKKTTRRHPTCGAKLKKAMFHFEATAMAGHEQAKYDLARCEKDLGNTERAIKHLRIAASAGCFEAMHVLIKCFKSFEEDGFVNRESIDTTLAACNNSCAEMRSESRDKRCIYTF